MKNINYILDKYANLITIRDPMFVIVGDTYYLTGTQPSYWKGINDGVRLWSTKDLKNYEYHGIILSRNDIPEDSWGRERFWAPEIFDGEDGWFYLTVSCRKDPDKDTPFGIHLARAKEITGPYELITKDEPLCSGIDGTIFKEDGKFYIGHNGPKKLFLDEFDPQTGKVLSSQLVCEAGVEGEWDSIGVEGQCIVKRNGIYFMWYSSWTDDDYRAGVLTSDSIKGPWVKSPQNPVIKSGNGWVKGGHNHSFHGLDGKDYISFHGFEAESLEELDEDFHLERMYIREIVYNNDGTVEIKY